MSSRVLFFVRKLYIIGQSVRAGMDDRAPEPFLCVGGYLMPYEIMNKIRYSLFGFQTFVFNQETVNYRKQ